MRRRRPTRRPMPSPSRPSRPPRSRRPSPRPRPPKPTGPAAPRPKRPTPRPVKAPTIQRPRRSRRKTIGNLSSRMPSMRMRRK